jgi:hypothetical protein
VRSGSPPEVWESKICGALHAQRRLQFEYEGHVRIVEPYCHGTGPKGAQLLRAVQVGGTSGSGARGFGFGKLWTVAKMKNLQVHEVRFQPNDPNYNPEDRAMAAIHCRVRVPGR